MMSLLRFRETVIFQKIAKLAISRKIKVFTQIPQLEESLMVYQELVPLQRVTIPHRVKKINHHPMPSKEESPK